MLGGLSRLSRSVWSPGDRQTTRNGARASVARTGRLLCVGESFPWGGVTAEVIARVMAEGFHLLDAAPQRLNSKDTPIPYHPNLWKAHRPTASSIAAALRRLLRF